MYLFDHGEPEIFLVFVWNFNMTLMCKETLETYGGVKYLCMLVHRKALHQCDLLYSDVENTYTSLTVDYLHKGLAWYFSL